MKKTILRYTFVLMASRNFTSWPDVFLDLAIATEDKTRLQT